MIIRDITQNESTVFNQAATHPLQSFEWGEFRKKTGLKVIRKGIFKKNKLITPVQVTIHPIPKTNFKVGYYPRGPMPDDNQIKLLYDIGKKNNCIMVKMEPNISSKISDGHLNIHTWKTIDNFLLKRGLRPGRPLFTRHTFQVNLKASEEEILSKMHSKTRYNIRLAQKKGVKVAIDNSENNFKWFLKLLFEQTVERQGFYAHSPEYFKKLWEILKPTGIAHLLRAYYKDQTLAVFMVFVFNKIIYYPYGASTRDRRELMAPNLVMWETIKEGKRLGCKVLDMWGALGPKPNKKDSWYGFHRFKKGYGGDLVKFLGTYDVVVNKQLYPIYRLADSLRWRGLKTKAFIKKQARNATRKFIK
ncbi:MAG: peptidoglycan bridge formation glycyltransferase FemA/FemB family protein [Patescibacteria group bacterium]|nr:peptidoglycan bridge formation glycyltransferase FemA/FemB family protein [Patescibacteria group bacterium]